jgi:hypothetical protein
MQTFGRFQTAPSGTLGIGGRGFGMGQVGGNRARIRRWAGSGDAVYRDQPDPRFAAGFSPFAQGVTPLRDLKRNELKMIWQPKSRTWTRL